MTPAELFDLTGRPALVTGAAGHLGRSIAVALAGAGSPTWLVGRRREPLDEVASLVRRSGGEALVHVCDVSDFDSVLDVADAVRRRHGRLDVLVSNAHVGRGGTLDIAHPDDFAEAANLASGSLHRLLRAFGPLLREAVAQGGAPSVIGIASMYGKVAPRHDIYSDPRHVNPPYYGAAKAGLLQLCRYSAIELAPAGIRVNTISPGPFPADVDPEFRARLAGLTPTGRTGRADEIATAALYLASPFSSFTTGSDLAVDGGWTAW